jgi:hypothetical protein
MDNHVELESDQTKDWIPEKKKSFIPGWG